MNPFLEIYTDANPNGTTDVYWGLRSEFTEQGPYEFTIEWAESPTASWAIVTSVIDLYNAQDTTKRTYGKELNSWYRITLVTATGTYTSVPHQATGPWNKHDWLIARDVCRKEYKLQDKFVGVKGTLLKRKLAGALCTCVNTDTGEATSTDCYSCYGTSRYGGYWPGLATAYIPSSVKTPKQTTVAGEGTVEVGSNVQARFIAYPHLNTGDIFVVNGDNKRYVVGQVTTACELKNIPLVYVVELILLPFTDIAYSIPLTGGPIEPPATPEPEVPVLTRYIWWDSNKWAIGSALGSNILFQSVGGYPVLAGLLNATWLDSGTDEVSDLTITSNEDGATIDVSEVDEITNGSYVQLDGNHNGLICYGKE